MPKERFNEDYESVAKSTRGDLSQKVKYNLLNSGAMPKNKEDGSYVTGMKSKTSRFQSSNGKKSIHSRLRAGSITGSKKTLQNLYQPTKEGTQENIEQNKSVQNLVIVDQGDAKNDARASQKQLDDYKSVHESDGGEEKGGDVNIGGEDYQAVITKYDADNSSSITFLTEATSALVNQNPSSIAYTQSSKLELQLNFLAKELEVERKRREALQKKVEDMHEELTKQQKET